MSTHKDEKNGTWYVMVRYHDWKGVKRQKCKRGFATRREEQEWERNFQLQTDGDPDMTFEAFMELYENDMRPRLKENTWLSKEHMIRTKLFPTLARRCSAKSKPGTTSPGRMSCWPTGMKRSSPTRRPISRVSITSWWRS